MNEDHEIRKREDFRETAVKEKLFTAEQHTSTVRLLIVVINALIYSFMMSKKGTLPWLAYSVIALSFIYSLYVVRYKPYIKYPLLQTSYFTFLTDGGLIALWVMATGMVTSPFYLLWYISIVAVAQRYSLRETMLTSAIYSLIYLILIDLDHKHSVGGPDTLVRIVYIPVTGLLAAYFSREFESQIQDKLQAKEANEKTQKAQKRMRGLLNNLGKEIEQKIKAETKLHDIQRELEQRVKDRTEDLEGVNEQLKLQIREKEKIQQMQEHTLRKLEQINGELESFAYVTSHDLKAPLRGIASIADWLHEDYITKLDENGKKNLQMLNQRVQRMNDLIEGILQYSRAGRQKEVIEVFSSEQLISELIDLLHPPDDVKIELSGEFPEIEANKTLLTQVIENLISNAIKFSDKKAGRIEVHSHDDGQEWMLSVKDNGKGIDQKYHSKIFEMFQTIDNKANSDSTGIGLAIAKKVMNGMGGRIWVESEPGAGATFILAFPKSIVKTQANEHT